MIFRVHFADGAKIEVDAETSKAAVETARRRHPEGSVAGSKAIVNKVKLVRSK
jgi:hypothetical protein